MQAWIKIQRKKERTTNVRQILTDQSLRYNQRLSYFMPYISTKLNKIIRNLRNIETVKYIALNKI